MLSEIDLAGRLDAAFVCHQAGQLQEAEARYRDILQQRPDELDALNLLGLLLQDRHDYAEAIALLSRAVELDPEFPEALTNLARAQFATGDHVAAATNAQRAVALEPKLGEAYLQYGRACLALDRNQEAADVLRVGVTLMPDSFDAHMHLGLALARLNEYPVSIRAYEAALQLKPDEAKAHHDLGAVCGQMRLTERAVACFRRAVELEPENPTFRARLALALRENREIEASFAAAQRALEMAPDAPDLWVLQGENFGSKGRFDEAEQSYRRALELAPELSDALVGLGRIRRLDPQEAGIGRLQEVLRDARMPTERRVQAGFALGSTLDRAGQFGAAFDSYAQANSLALEALDAQGRRFDPDEHAERVNWLIRAFGPEAFQATSGWGNPSEVPVFVLGMPRSGTTLVEQIVSSHPQVFGAGELKDIARIAERLEAGTSRRLPRDWERESVQREAEAHLAHLRELSPDAARIVDKLPDNSLLLGHIAVLFPRARVILCRRDLRDVGLSTFFTPFTDAVTWSFDQAACAARTCEIERLLWHWRDVLPGRLFEVQYEALVADLESESRRLIDFLGLDWDPACLAFHETERLVMTASGWQVRQPLYSSSVRRWRHYRPYLGPLLEGLGGVVAPAEDEEPATPEQAVAVILEHRAAGRHAAAEAACRVLLSRHPDQPDALYLLGRMRWDRGQSEEALPLLERAAALRPKHFQFVLELGKLQLASGASKAAATSGARAIALAPDSYEAHLLAGAAEAELENATAAVDALQRAVALNPKSFEANFALGSVLTRLGDFTSALASLSTALEIMPDHAGALSKLAVVYGQLDQHEPALELHNRALELAPKETAIHQALVASLQRTRDPIATIEACNRALALDENQPVIWLALAYAQAALGWFPAAAKCYRRVLALKPDDQHARLGLVEIGGASLDAAEVAELTATLGDAQVELEARAAAGFTLGATLERKGEYDAAFAAFAEANRLLLESRQPAGAVTDLDMRRRLFTPGTFRLTADWGDRSELPVFIVGLPRSGTSLVEQILASHPEVFGAGERKDIQRIVSFLEASQASRAVSEWNPLAVRKEAAWHVAKLRDLAERASRVVDKMPDNILFAGHIRVLFPRARIIICRRDLRDVSLSCYFQRFVDRSLAWANDLDQIATRAREIEELIALWREVLPGPMIEVQYEHLVANLESESRRLIDFLGLEWNPACLSFHQTERVVMTASHWQVRQPIYASSIGRWRNYRKHLGPLLEGLAGLVPEDDGA